MKTFIIKTLGCKVNQYESQVLREGLSRLGFRETDSPDADVAIINSCTVTGKADSKTKRLIKRIKKDNPRTRIFVTGCFAVFDEDSEKVRTMPEVYGVIPNRKKMELPGILGSLYGIGGACKPEKERVSGFGSHTRAFLKIQDGCDQKCSYCKVNMVRGPSRSKEKRETVEELAALIGSGYREIVLTGICLGAWKGKNGEELSELLRDIEKIEGDFRIRLSSIEPNCISASLIDSIADSKKICRHLHIPLQSGSDRILKLMNRKYNTAQFERITGQIRAKMPLIGITMDIISGFPGETDEDFRRTIDFVRRIRPSRMHVFGYSDRKGTPAFKIKDKVPSREIKTRVSQLIEVGEKLQEDFCGEFVGKEVEVLVEERLTGYSGEYVKVKLGGFPAREGSLIRVKAKEKEKNSPRLLVL